MSSRAAAWLAWLVCGSALALATSGMFLVLLNGGQIRSAETTGSAILAISFSVVGAVIVSRRPGNPIGWVFLIGGFFNSLNTFSAEYPEYALLTNPGPWPAAPFFAWLFTWAFAGGFAAFPLTLLLFPTGRPPSPRWRPILWLVAAGILLMVVPFAVAAWPFRGPALVNTYLWSGETVAGPVVTLQQAGIALVGLSMLASVVSIIVRFRRASAEERQQIKWLVYAGLLTFIILATASPAAPLDLPDFVSEPLSILSLLALPSIPVAVGIAILRYRLYDIDLVINRTLVYTALTASLVLVYVGGVVSLQYAFRDVTGGESQLAVVASTLAIAALFNPLRRRIQGIVDRRFYRKKYDAARVLAAFNTRLRDEVDLDALSGDLVGVVRETMQPRQVSLWLRPPKSE